jgi:trigger factor
MSENQSAVAESTQEFVYPVKVENVGPAAKKVTVDIPPERISAKLAEQFKELRQHAQVPGFRAGHVPQKLLEKRFHNDVREQVRRDLLDESYKQAIEDNKIQVLGEPEFENVEALKLPDEGALSYSFQVEVQPDITLPELGNLMVKKPKIEVTEKNMEAAMTSLREQNGALTPVEDRGVESGDYLIADVHVKVGDEIVTHQHNAQLVARPGRLAGVQIDDLDQKLAGMKPEETRTIDVKMPETHANEQLKGKDAKIEILLHDIKHMELADIDEGFLEDLGFKNQEELQNALKEQMELRLKSDVQRAMHDQIRKYLLDNTQVEIPVKLSQKQTDRVINRRRVDMLMRGVQQDQLEAEVEKLRGAVQEEAARDLKLFFILQKIATDRNIDVNESEMNGRIAMIAAQRGQRPEKVKQEMSKSGALLDLYLNLREERTLDSVLETTRIEEVEPEK